MQSINDGMGAMVLPPRFTCSGCGITWELSPVPGHKGEIKTSVGLYLFPVDTGEQN